MSFSLPGSSYHLYLAATSHWAVLPRSTFISRAIMSTWDLATYPYAPQPATTTSAERNERYIQEHYRRLRGHLPPTTVCPPHLHATILGFSHSCDRCIHHTRRKYLHTGASRTTSVPWPARRLVLRLSHDHYIGNAMWRVGTTTHPSTLLATCPLQFMLSHFVQAPPCVVMEAFVVPPQLYTRESSCAHLAPYLRPRPGHHRLRPTKGFKPQVFR